MMTNGDAERSRGPDAAGAPGALNPETRAVVDAVIEALDIPYAATVGHDETRTAILLDRVRHLLVCMRALADGDSPLSPLSAKWHLEYLRERLAGHPPVGYVTLSQAQERLAQGATWTDAVTLDPPTGEVRGGEAS